MNTPIKVAVQSTRRLVRDALAACLAGRPDFTVVGRTARCSDLPELCLLRHPDALLVEATGPDRNRVEAISTVRARHPDTTIVVVYHSLTPAEMVRAYQAGISALVPYTRGLDAVVAALKAHRDGRAGDNRHGSPGGLTDRELEILSLICAGHSVREVAAVLGISPRTVENHKRRIYDKLGVHSQAQAVAHVAQLGLVHTSVAQAPPRDRSEPPDPPGAPTCVVVRGRPGPARDTVTRTLTDGGVGTVLDGPGPAPDTHITVLVDPTPDDWPAQPAGPIIMVHGHGADQAVTVDAALRGADAVVRADRVGERLLPVLSVVRQGCFAMDAAQARSLFTALYARFTPVSSAVPASVLPELTAREHDILQSIARGDTVRQTARSLGISVKTVENTQGRLFRKLGARNRAGALAVAHGLGLLESHPPG